MSDTTFADELNRATYDEIMPGGRGEEGHKRELSAIRQALRRAQRFTLDDDAVRLICRMTRQTKRLELWSILARLPFDTMWMEFNLHTKVLEFQKMGTLRQPFKPDEVSTKIGYLLQKDKDSDTRWMAREFIEHDGHPIPQSVAMVFDPEGSALKPVTGSVLWNSLTLSKHFGKRVMPVHVQAENKDGTPVEVKIDQVVDCEFGYLGIMDFSDVNTIKSPPEMDYKIGAVPDPVWVEFMRPDVLDKLMLSDALERTGVLKWLITALAVINDVPKTTRLLRRRHGQMYTKAGPMKYLDTHVITINIPKPHDYRYVGRKLSEAAVQAHRAWHRVRGHWRIIEYGKKNLFLCRHEPTMVENGLAMCQRCERLIRWIDEQHRGDPRLGIISHEYRVKT